MQTKSVTISFSAKPEEKLQLKVEANENGMDFSSYLRYLLCLEEKKEKKRPDVCPVCGRRLI